MLASCDELCLLSRVKSTHSRMLAHADVADAEGMKERRRERRGKREREREVRTSLTAVRADSGRNVGTNKSSSSSLVMQTNEYETVQKPLSIRSLDPLRPNPAAPAETFLLLR